MNKVIFSLKQNKKILAKALLALPNEDAYAEVYCIITDAIRRNNEILLDLSLALIEAKRLSKEDPNQPDNTRARGYCLL